MNIAPALRQLGQLALCSIAFSSSAAESVAVSFEEQRRIYAAHVPPESRGEPATVESAYIAVIVADAAKRFGIDLAAVYLARLARSGAVLQRISAGAGAGPVPAVSDPWKIHDDRTRRSRPLTWALAPGARRLLSMGEWLCTP